MPCCPQPEELPAGDWHDPQPAAAVLGRRRHHGRSRKAVQDDGARHAPHLHPHGDTRWLGCAHHHGDDRCAADASRAPVHPELAVLCPGRALTLPARQPGLHCAGKAAARRFAPPTHVPGCPVVQATGPRLACWPTSTRWTRMSLSTRHLRGTWPWWARTMASTCQPRTCRAGVAAPASPRSRVQHPPPPGARGGSRGSSTPVSDALPVPLAQSVLDSLARGDSSAQGAGAALLQQHLQTAAPTAAAAVAPAPLQDAGAALLPHFHRRRPLSCMQWRLSRTPPVRRCRHCCSS